MIPQSRRVERGTSASFVAHIKHVSICGQIYITNKRSNVRPVLYIHCDDLHEMQMNQRPVGVKEVMLSKFSVRIWW